MSSEVLGTARAPESSMDALDVRGWAATERRWLNVTTLCRAVVADQTTLFSPSPAKGSSGTRNLAMGRPKAMLREAVSAAVRAVSEALRGLAAQNDGQQIIGAVRARVKRPSRRAAGRTVLHHHRAYRSSGRPLAPAAACEDLGVLLAGSDRTSKRQGIWRRPQEPCAITSGSDGAFGRAQRRGTAPHGQSSGGGSV